MRAITILNTILMVTLVATVTIADEVVILTPSDDTYIAEENPNANYGETPRFRIGNAAGNEDYDQIAFIRFPISENNIPNVPNGSTITNAFVTIYVWSDNGHRPLLRIHEVTMPDNWTENGLNWNDNWNYDDNYLELGDFGSDANNRLFWRSRTARDGVRDQVRDWYEGRKNNDGFAIASELNIEDYNYIDFVSKDYADNEYTIPTLTIFYEENDVGDDHNNTYPTKYRILKCYPNPFNPELNMTIGLPQPSEMVITIYNINGQAITELANDWFDPGYHTFTFDGSDLASGIYFVQATVPGRMNEMRKVVLMK